MLGLGQLIEHMFVRVEMVRVETPCGATDDYVLCLQYFDSSFLFMPESFLGVL